MSRRKAALIIPARDEEEALPAVLRSIPPQVDIVIVVDNGSRDATAAVAAAHGAVVVPEPVPGYGRACLAALSLLASDPPEVVAFADGDGSDDLSMLPLLIDRVAAGELDLALGRRVPAESGAFTPQQRFGNALATLLVRSLWKQRFHDLGPMRAISWSGLQRLRMQDTGFGWTVEMQVRGVKEGLRVAEIDVPYRRRAAGSSKISGTLVGSVRAGWTILRVITREALVGPLRAA